MLLEIWGVAWGWGESKRTELSRADNFSQLVMGKPTATVLRVSVDPCILWPLCPWTVFLEGVRVLISPH